MWCSQRPRVMACSAGNKTCSAAWKDGSLLVEGWRAGLHCGVGLRVQVLISGLAVRNYGMCAGPTCALPPNLRSPKQ